ncbi:MAG: histidine phosphatase family protein [Treponema sp.]|nr:histidine phosphatase family protein [Treponema sp.]
MTVYLIRHGKTEANERRLYCGSTDLPLSEKGREELSRVRYSLPPARFLTSGMRRANETLRVLFGDVAFEEEPGFREVDFGLFEMKSYDQLKDTPEYQRWICGNNEENVPPGGESGVQMKQRVLRAYRALEEDTVVVTHGGVIAAIMEELFPGEGKNRYQWQPENGCGYVISEGSYRPLP